MTYIQHQSVNVDVVFMKCQYKIGLDQIINRLEICILVHKQKLKEEKKQSNISDPPVNIIHMTTRTTNTPEMDHWMNDLYIVTYISYKHEIFKIN